MSLLSKALHGIHLDSHSLGNLLKNVSPALAFTPAGLIGTGLAAGIGELGRGKNIRQAVTAGAENAAIGGGLRAGAGLVQGALNHGTQAAVAGLPGAGGGLPAAATDTVPTGGLSLPSVPNLTTAGAAPVDPRGFISKALDTGGHVADWLGNHDKTASAVFGTLGDVIDPSERRLRAARTAALTSQNATSDYDLQRKKASDLALEPIRQALYGGLGTQIGANNAGVARNPYSNGGQP